MNLSNFGFETYPQADACYKLYIIYSSNPGFYTISRAHTCYKLNIEEPSGSRLLNSVTYSDTYLLIIRDAKPSGLRLLNIATYLLDSQILTYLPGRQTPQADAYSIVLLTYLTLR